MLDPPPLKCKDCAALYPPEDTVAKALQEMGKVADDVKKGKVVGKKTNYGPLKKVANHVYKELVKAYCKASLHVEGMTKSDDRARKHLLNGCCTARKFRDLTEVGQYYHQYGSNRKVIIVPPVEGMDPERAGMDFILGRFQDFCHGQRETKPTAPTMNDGLHCCAIMLDEKNITSVSSYLSGKKPRASSNQTGDPTLHMFEEMVADFNDSNYMAALPSDKMYSTLDEEERRRWNPNNPEIFNCKRNGLWLQKTWTGYIKTKCKDSLYKWNKGTGGGGGKPHVFANFCGREKWQVLIYMLDLAANFLLASSAGGTMPSHLTMEGSTASVLFLSSALAKAKSEPNPEPLSKDAGSCPFCHEAN